MAVAQLCREAGGIAGDGSLSGQIQPAGGHRAGVHRKAQARPEGVPEGQQLVEAQTHRDTDRTALAGHRLVAGQQLLLVGVEVQAVVGVLVGFGFVVVVVGVVFVGVEYGYGDLESMKKEGGRVFVKTTAELLDVLTK